MTEKFLRLFLAIKISEENKALIKTASETLQKKINSTHVKWINEAQWHLTVHFLGDVASDKIKLLSEKLTETIQHHDVFEIQSQKIILLPFNHPQVIAVAVKLNHSLAELYKDSKNEIEKLGIKLEDRPYLPHITFARIKDKMPKLKISLDNITFTQQVKEVVLFQSQLTEDGSLYTALAKMPLRHTSQI